MAATKCLTGDEVAVYLFNRPNLHNELVLLQVLWNLPPGGFPQTDEGIAMFRRWWLERQEGLDDQPLDRLRQQISNISRRYGLPEVIDSMALDLILYGRCETPGPSPVFEWKQLGTKTICWVEGKTIYRDRGILRERVWEMYFPSRPGSQPLAVGDLVSWEEPMYWGQAMPQRSWIEIEDGEFGVKQCYLCGQVISDEEARHSELEFSLESDYLALGSRSGTSRMSVPDRWKMELLSCPDDPLSLTSAHILFYPPPLAVPTVAVALSSGVGLQGETAPELRPEQQTPVEAQPDPADRPLNVFRKQGEYWDIAFQGGEQFRLRDMKGLNYIHCLLGYPFREFPVTELYAATEKHIPDDRMVASLEGDYGDEREYGITDLGGDQTVFDTQTRDTLRARLDELIERREDAESWDNANMKEEIDQEVEWIREELRVNLDYKGEPRKMPDEHDKLRQAVYKTIERAREKIRQHDPGLYEYLKDHIETGARCCYSPNSNSLLDWEL